MSYWQGLPLIGLGSDNKTTLVDWCAKGVGETIVLAAENSGNSWADVTSSASERAQLQFLWGFDDVFNPSGTSPLEVWGFEDVFDPSGTSPAIIFVILSHNHPTALTQKIQQVIIADDVDFDVDAEEVYFIHLNIALGPFFLWKC